MGATPRHAEFSELQDHELRDRSFRNLCGFYYVELLQVHEGVHACRFFTQPQLVNLRKLGILAPSVRNWRVTEGQLTEKTVRTLTELGYMSEKVSQELF